MRIITWNINSVRARPAILEQLVNEYVPDILCLQETKVEDNLFPARFFEDLGYPHQAIRGQKSYHGVATLSRVPLAGSYSIDWCEVGDARHIAVALDSGQHIHNFYVPAGGDIPDPEENDKFAHKLRFLDEMKRWSADLSDPSILVGDLNVAPWPEDVWNHKALLKVVSHTPVETDALKDIIAAHDWQDVMRHHCPLPEKLFSWWSYRARDWSASDRGRRLDHIWTSPGLLPQVRHMDVIRHARGWEKPSDHAPVLMDIDL